MIYTRSALEEINLSGNVLMNEGVITLLRGVAIAKSLKKLLIADNQFNDDQEVLKALLFCMRRNEKLGKYDLKYNIITEAGKWLETVRQTCRFTFKWSANLLFEFQAWWNSRPT